MDIIEAKRLYMQANACLSNLERDGLYDEFMQLRITEDTLKKWQEELIENYKKIVLSALVSNFTKIKTIYQIDEMEIEGDENLQFIIDWYIKSYKDMDAFSRMLLCEVLSSAKYKHLLLKTGVDLKEENDYLIEILQNGFFSIDTSFEKDPYLEENDFKLENIFARLTRLKKQLADQPQPKKIGLWDRLFKKKQ